MHTLPKKVLSLVMSASLAALLVPAPALAEVAGPEPAAEEAADGGAGPAEGNAPEAVADASDPVAEFEDDGPSEDPSAGPAVDGSEGAADGSEASDVAGVSLGTQADEASGTFHGMDWRLTSDGELILGRAGEEQTLSNGGWMGKSSWPWDGSRSAIASVRVEGTVHASGSLGYMFYGCSKLSSLDLSGLDTSHVTSMYDMFYGCSGLSSLDLSGLDTSHVTSMYGMFYGCSGLSSLDLSGLDTSAATDMSYMFYGCSGLSSLDLSGLDTSAATSMYGMFSGCSSLSSLDLSGLDTSAATSMSFMFSGCSSLSSLDLSGFDTSSATDMSSMFQGCSSLSYLDLSGWDTSSVTRMVLMFHGCSSLTFLDVYGWDTSSVTRMSSMFSGCSSLSFLDVSGWDTCAVTDMSGMFHGCSSLAYLDLSGWNTDAVAYTGGMFNNCTSLCRVRLGEGCTRMEKLPFPRATGDRWLSEGTGTWYAPSEIASQRLGVADTYTCTADTKPAGGFTDVDAYTPHLEDVLWLAAKGISTGYNEWDGTKTFRGMEPVYRQDMAAFLSRLAGKPSYVPTQKDIARFRDVSWSTPHATEIWWLASEGISEGWDMHDGTFEFRGMDTVKRQDMAAFLRRLARRMGADVDAPGATNPFRDVSDSTPHYEDILWLASTGVTKGWDMGDDTFEYRGMNDVVRQDMAAFLHRLDNYVKGSAA